MKTNWTATVALASCAPAACQAFASGGPRFASHRGESADAPENTMAAVRLAADRKAGGACVSVYNAPGSSVGAIALWCYARGPWDEVRVYDCARTADEISARAPLLSKGTLIRIHG